MVSRIKDFQKTLENRRKVLKIFLSLHKIVLNFLHFVLNFLHSFFVFSRSADFSLFQFAVFCPSPIDFLDFFDRFWFFLLDVFGIHHNLKVQQIFQDPEPDCLFLDLDFVPLGHENFLDPSGDSLLDGFELE